MLNLNQRLETYLSWAKLLEDENTLLTKEIQALRCSGHHDETLREGLEEKLQQTRQEVDSAWRERARVELEVGRLMEELQDLDRQRQREAQARLKASKMLERSRKEMWEEERAQIWLRDTLTQLEQEVQHLIQRHQDDVAHLEATLTQSWATGPPTLAQRAKRRANVLQLGQELSQQASRAWQEAARAYQGQVAHLEDSVKQARSRLMQVGQEKSESQLELQVLEKELATAQDVKMHLEETLAQLGQSYSQQVQELQVSPGHPNLWGHSSRICTTVLAKLGGAEMRTRGTKTLFLWNVLIVWEAASAARGFTLRIEEAARRQEGRLQLLSSICRTEERKRAALPQLRHLTAPGCPGRSSTLSWGAPHQPPKA